MAATHLVFFWGLLLALCFDRLIILGGAQALGGQ